MELKNSSEKSCFVIKPNTKKTFFIAILKPVAIYTQNIKIKDVIFGKFLTPKSLLHFLIKPVNRYSYKARS